VESQQEVYRLRAREEKDYGPHTRGWIARTHNKLAAAGHFGRVISTSFA
jgi:hypothetical protein